MKRATLPRIKPRFPHLFLFLLLASLVFSLTVGQQTGYAQQSQLTLADILTGLRSKKVSLVERNQLLTGAVKKRGVTFSLSPEIEKELQMTGADNQLIAAIREKDPEPEISAVPNPSPTPGAPVIDFAFYQNRANARFVEGEYDLAVADYNKVIELNPKDTSIYFNRGTAYYNKKSYGPAIADYDKAIGFNPKEVKAYLNRADAYEKIGNIESAISDYQKAADLEPANESAKNNLKRLQALLQAKSPPPEPKKTETAAVNAAAQQPKSQPAVPEIVELGELNRMALNLAMPIYPVIARKAGIQGKVIVQVKLDEEGKVESAKAASGPAMLRDASEDAVKKSKFKPAMVGDKPIKSSGFIIYNFVN